MSMLINSVPESLTIAGTEYEIKTDFRVWLKFEMMLTDEVSDSATTLADIKKLIFKSDMPPEREDEETAERILWFYRCGKPEQKNSSSSSKEVFSYEYDDGYICAAFMEQYHIDINTVKLHWWKFRAFMLALSEETEFVKIMGFRSIEITSKMTAAQKAYYQKMKKLYKLPVKKEVQEKISAIEEALIKGEPIDNML